VTCPNPFSAPKPFNAFAEQQRQVLIAAVERAQLRAGRPVRTAEIHAELSMHDLACLELPTINMLARRLTVVSQGGVDQHGRTLTRQERSGHALWSVRIQLATPSERLRAHPEETTLAIPVRMMRSNELHWLIAAVSGELERRGEPLNAEAEPARFPTPLKDAQ
jgi:hypothetical protein